MSDHPYRPLYVEVPPELLEKKPELLAKLKPMQATTKMRTAINYIVKHCGEEVARGLDIKWDVCLAGDADVFVFNGILNYNTVDLEQMRAERWRIDGYDLLKIFPDKRAFFDAVIDAMRNVVRLLSPPAEVHRWHQACRVVGYPTRYEEACGQWLLFASRGLSGSTVGNIVWTSLAEHATSMLDYGVQYGAAPEQLEGALCQEWRACELAAELRVSERTA